MFEFVSGLITMGYVTAGLFLLRFWARTRDGLFLAFAAAFWLLAANQGLLTIYTGRREEETSLSLLRLAAFGLIIVAIAAKNRQARTRR